MLHFLKPRNEATYACHIRRGNLFRDERHANSYYCGRYSDHLPWRHTLGQGHAGPRLGCHDRGCRRFPVCFRTLDEKAFVAETQAETPSSKNAPLNITAPS
jgi:hypothetical protein